MNEQTLPANVGSNEWLGLVERLRQGSSNLTHDATMQEAANEIESLMLAEEGAKTAFAHVVEQKHEIERECTKLRANLSAAHRALQLELQQHKRSHAEVLRLAEQLRKYEPGKPMHLA